MRYLVIVGGRLESKLLYISVSFFLFQRSCPFLKYKTTSRSVQDHYHHIAHVKPCYYLAIAKCLYTRCEVKYTLEYRFVCGNLDFVDSTDLGLLWSIRSREALRNPKTGFSNKRLHKAEVSIVPGCNP